MNSNYSRTFAIQSVLFSKIKQMNKITSQFDNSKCLMIQ